MEWMHTLKMEDITLATEVDKPEEFLLYTDELLKMFGINLKVSANEGDKHEHTEDDKNDNTSLSRVDGNGDENSYDS